MHRAGDNRVKLLQHGIRANPSTYWSIEILIRWSIDATMQSHEESRRAPTFPWMFQSKCRYHFTLSPAAWNFGTTSGKRNLIDFHSQLNSTWFPLQSAKFNVSSSHSNRFTFHFHSIKRTISSVSCDSSPLSQNRLGGRGRGGLINY